MDLQNKILITFIILLCILLSSISLFISGITLSNYNSLEKQYVEKDLMRAENVFNDEIRALGNFLSDWAAWDDTYFFILGENPDFIKNNLIPEIYENINLNFVIIIDRNNNLVYSGYYDKNEESIKPVPEEMLEHLSLGLPLTDIGIPGQYTGGILVLPDYPVMITSMPVVKTDFSGEPAGILIWGRILDPVEIDRLSQITGSALSIDLIDGTSILGMDMGKIRSIAESQSPLIEPINNDIIAGYSIIRDIYGNDALLFSITEPRDIYHQGLSNSLHFILFILVSGFFLGLFIIVLLNRWVLDRLDDLKNQVHSVTITGDYSGNITISGDDELSHFSSEINLMLKNIDEAHKDLAASETRFRELSDLLPQIIFELDKDLNLTYINKYGLELFGLSDRDLKSGLRAYHFVYPADIPRMEANLRKRVLGEVSAGEVYTLIQKSGQPIRVLLYTSPIIRNNDLDGFRGSGIDVSKRLELEEALNESQQYLQALLSKVQVGIVVIDPETHVILDANPAASDMIGLEREKIVGQNCHRYLCPPEGRKCPITDLDQSIDNAERVLINVDGNEIPIIKYVTPVMLHGKKCLLETFIDNSDRKRMENEIRRGRERLENIIRALPVGIFETDPDGCVLFASQSTLDIIKRSYEEIRGKHWSSIIHPDDRMNLASELRYQSRERGMSGAEARILRPDGSIIWVYGQSVTVYNPDGSIKGHVATITDITVRKDAEEALVKSEEKYRTLAESIADVIFSIDLSGVITYISPLVMRYGYTAGEVIGRSFAEFIHPDERDMILSSFKNEISNGFHSTQTFRIFGKDGKVWWLEESSTTKSDQYGNPTGLYGILRDVTDRMMAEQALKESREMLDGILKASPVGVFRTDQNGKIQYVNNTFTNMTGLAPESVRGSQWTDAIDPSDLERVLSETRDVIANEEIIDIETRLLQANGSVLWVYIKAVPINSILGRLTGWVGAFIDITLRKKTEQALAESEQKYRAITENTADILYSIDIEGNVTYVSPQINLYGFLIDEIIGRPLNVIFHPEDRAAINEMIEMEIHDQVRSSLTLRIIDNKNNIHWVEMRSSLKLDQDGNPVGFYGILRDMTDRKRAADAIELANKKLNLMNNITRHDILNTITGLFGLVDMTNAAKTPEERAELLLEIKNLGRIIERQITFTKEYQEVGVRQPRWQVLSELVVHAWQNVAQTGISIDVRLDTIEIYADPLLEKVIHNLIDNAVRYGNTITRIEFYYKVIDRGLLVICEDDGDGIPIDMKNSIFERGIGRNTGMGLFLSREILAITGITINENGLPGKGAKFEIFVPWENFRMGRI